MNAWGTSHRIATWRLLVAALLLAAGGCARVVRVTPAPPAPPAQRIPLDVGLYVTREFKAYAAEIRDADPWISLDLWRYVNLGAASAQQFERELAATFRSVQIVAEAPSATQPASPGLAVVVEPAIENFDVVLRNMFRPLSAYVTYRIKLYGPDGQLWMNSSVEGSATAHVGPPRISGMAVENAVANAVHRIIESDGMRALLKGASNPAVMMYSSCYPRARSPRALDSPRERPYDVERARKLIVNANEQWLAECAKAAAQQ